jgi:hypothetical protein
MLLGGLGYIPVSHPVQGYARESVVAEFGRAGCRRIVPLSAEASPVLSKAIRINRIAIDHNIFGTLLKRLNLCIGEVEYFSGEMKPAVFYVNGLSREQETTIGNVTRSLPIEVWWRIVLQNLHPNLGLSPKIGCLPELVIRTTASPSNIFPGM